ncbi:MAG: response regulator transcription factor [Myxococcales bacterium]|nr:response regulator transcription factor [Myxococcales bacterium]
MSKPLILVVDDEEDILELIRYNLAKEGYQVGTVTTGEDALAFARREKPNLVILDLMLPGVDGLEVCKRLKANDATAAIPVIMLTAKSEDADVVTGLELGADDYLTKPFSPRVLVARVRTALRRRQVRIEEPATPLRVQDLAIDVGRHEVRIKGKAVDLTPTEFNLLLYLAQRPGFVFSRSQIIDAVKGSDYPVTDRSVDVQIVSLRRKLGAAGKYVETVRGVGYRFKE